MSKVIVFGSLNMDLSVACDSVPGPGETVLGSGFMTSPGGKGANQAYAAALMGALPSVGTETYMVGAVGDDAFGRQLSGSLADIGVGCDFLHVRDTDPTGCAVIIRSHAENRIVVSPGANALLTTDEVCAAIDELGEPGDVFLTQLECDVATTIDALAYAHEKGLVTFLNAAPACDGLAGTFPSLDYLCVNETEAGQITGISLTDPESELRALGILASWGVTIPVITLGARGSVALVDGLPTRFSSPVVKAVDSTGAGDAYVGAMCALIAAGGRDLAGILECSSAFAALACTVVGARPTSDLGERAVEATC